VSRYCCDSLIRFRELNADCFEQAKLTLADYFDIHLDHAPKEGAELVLDPIVLIARSISGEWVSVVGLRLHAANHTVGLRPGDCAGKLPI
jgi:hypothetical protein